MREPLKKGDFIITRDNDELYEVVEDEAKSGVMVKRLSPGSKNRIWMMQYYHKHEELSKLITTAEEKKKIYEYLNMLSLGVG